jgi:hypothetical protein
MAHLAQVTETHRLEVFGVQAALWDAVERGEVVFGGGVSAFPSLHVAMPILGACAAWRPHRWLAWAFLAFALVIFLGSIRLGWHYALDGEVSAVGVLIIWRLTRVIRPGTFSTRPVAHRRS